LKRDSA
jgi:hypothetical protein